MIAASFSRDTFKRLALNLTSTLEVTYCYVHLNHSKIVLSKSPLISDPGSRTKSLLSFLLIFAYSCQGSPVKSKTCLGSCPIEGESISTQISKMFMLTTTPPAHILKHYL